MRSVVKLHIAVPRRQLRVLHSARTVKPATPARADIHAPHWRPWMSAVKNDSGDSPTVSAINVDPCVSDDLYYCATASEQPFGVLYEPEVTSLLALPCA